MAGQPEGVMIIGADGLIGGELTRVLRMHNGDLSVVAIALRPKAEGQAGSINPTEKVDVASAAETERIITEHRVKTIVYLIGEDQTAHPGRAWDVEINGLANVLGVAHAFDLTRVLVLSSVVASGCPSANRLAPVDAHRDPQVRGESAGLPDEVIAAHSARFRGLDVRMLRCPTVISPDASPTTGTDYATDAFRAAWWSGHYDFSVREDATHLAIYMPDCIRAAIELMNADRERLTAPWYDVGTMRFSAGELAAEIRRHLPGFTYSFRANGRETPAIGSPLRFNDSAARRDWDWTQEYGLEEMVADLLDRLWD